MEFGIREGKPDDYAYVTDTWVRCYRTSKAALDAGDVYVAEQKRLIYHLIQTSKLLIAHAPDDEDAILGWAIGRPGTDPVIYYAYVRSDARRQKLACTLLCRLLNTSPEELSCLKVQFSHRPMLPSLKPPSTWTYNPYRNRDAVPAMQLT